MTRGRATDLHHFLVEVGVVHAHDGGLDVPSCRETLDLDLDIVGPALVEHCYELGLRITRNLKEEKIRARGHQI